MIVYCREHGQPWGEVRFVAGVPLLEIRRHHWQDRFGGKIEPPEWANERANEWHNLERAGPDVQTRCPGCSARTVKVADLLDAFESGRPKIAL